MLSTKATALSVLIMHPVLVFSQVDSTKTNKRIRITPLPVVYYSPETRFGFGALVAANFETVKIPDPITKSSYAQTYFLYTVNKQYDWGISTRIYGPQNDFIFSGKLNYSFFPEYYYGIATEDPESKKDTIEYNRLSADLRFFWKINNQFYTGFAARFNRLRDFDGGLEGHFNEDKPLGYDGYWHTGFAPAFMIETRDSFVYPRKGFFLEALYYFHPSWGQKSYAFNSLKLDIRKYFPIQWLSEIDALAFQFLADVNSGEVPVKDLADIGGSNTTRGYYTGFYRYKNLYAFQAEFRTHIWWRLGFTCWVGGALTSENGIRFLSTPLSQMPGSGCG